MVDVKADNLKIFMAVLHTERVITFSNKVLKVYLQNKEMIEL